jgi:hypothetical protein
MNGDYFEEPKEHATVENVDGIRDRFIAAGLPCAIERHGKEERLVFPGKKCYLAFTVNPAGRPLTASMPESEDYDADFAQVVFGVFDSIGWKFQR